VVVRRAVDGDWPRAEPRMRPGRPGRRACGSGQGGGRRGGGAGGVRRGAVADRAAGQPLGLAPAGEGGQGVTGRAGGLAQGPGDRARREFGGGIGGEAAGDLPAQLTLAEPTDRRDTGRRRGARGWGRGVVIVVSRWCAKGGRERRAGGPFPRGQFPFCFPLFPGTRRRYLGIPRPSTIFGLRNEKNSGYFTAGITRFSGADPGIPQRRGAMAAHSACAIRGDVVTVRRAPPARLRLAGGPASPAQRAAARRTRPRRSSPAPRSAWPASPGLARRDLAGAGRGGRTSRAGRRERRNVKGNTGKRPGTPGPGINDT
jgi:hypothetical protein